MQPLAFSEPKCLPPEVNTGANAVRHCAERIPAKIEFRPNREIRQITFWMSSLNC